MKSQKRKDKQIWKRLTNVSDFMEGNFETILNKHYPVIALQERDYPITFYYVNNLFRSNFFFIPGENKEGTKIINVDRICWLDDYRWAIWIDGVIRILQMHVDQVILDPIPIEDHPEIIEELLKKWRCFNETPA